MGALHERRSISSPERKKLSTREREVLNLLARGLQQTKIGKELSISPNTVKTYVNNLYTKYNTKLETTEDIQNQTVKLIIKGIHYKDIDIDPLLEDIDLARIQTLSKAEKRIYEFIINQAGSVSTRNEIGSKLFLSESTIKSHLFTSYPKLGARNKAHAVARYMAIMSRYPDEMAIDSDNQQNTLPTRERWTAMRETKVKTITRTVGEPTKKEEVSQRQYEIINLLAQGYSLEEIGTQLGIEPSTVRTYTLRVHEKFHKKTDKVDKKKRSHITLVIRGIQEGYIKTDLLLKGFSPDILQEKLNNLSSKQKEILDFIIANETLAKKNIKQAVPLADRTIAQHITACCTKLGTRNTIHTVAVYMAAKKAGLIE